MWGGHSLKPSILKCNAVDALMFPEHAWLSHCRDMRLCFLAQMCNAHLLH